MWVATLGLLTLPVVGASTPGPGTLNYLEGQVSMDGRKVSGTGQARLEQGGLLETSEGRVVELLLTPGVFLRCTAHPRSATVDSQPGRGSGQRQHFGRAGLRAEGLRAVDSAVRADENGP